MFNPRLGTLIVIVLAAAGTRLLPHLPNFTAMTALALFGGAYFSDRRLAIGVPLLALLISDIALGIYWQWSFKAIQGHMWVQYICFCGIVCMGFLLREGRSALRVGAVALSASVLFFIVTNFAEWLFQPWYPKTTAGLISSYVAGIPFFRNTVFGDLFYTALLFGGFHLLERRFMQLRATPDLGIA
ncbi:MAG TPA: DUF6580 family putative transport protein [Steroidobacteraceae bacterium]|nr:DUF6580 family putative transport protein [Steroidobacteraceae bacterium]